MGCAVITDESGKSVTFLCGDAIEVCHLCLRPADVLCDYPIGKGKTCDVLLCGQCAFEIGDDFHLCPIHYAEYRAKEIRVSRKGTPRLVNRTKA